MNPGSGERSYLRLVEDVMAHGEVRENRTGIRTRAKFGCHLRFSLDDGFPLLTTKRIRWKSVVEELLWFISGSTSSRQLAAKGVGIWDANGSRAALDRQGLHDREEGDLGPIYGFQWRHFGARYAGAGTDHTGQGVDQLRQIIHTLKTNPQDRRILLTAWNPSDLPLMALPPCHVMAQFFVSNQGALSCLLFQRSSDLGLGLPFNIASYALLTHLLAHIAGLGVGELVITLGDAHVYETHLAGLQEQLTREPRSKPRLVIGAKPTELDLDHFQASHLELVDYNPHPSIPMEMAV